MGKTFYQDFKMYLPVVWLLSILVFLNGCALLTPLPENVTTQQRIEVFNSISPPTFKDEVTIYWNTYQIPYITALDDNDAAFALGLVQAHLRLGQMEVAKRIVNGRISEMIGPFTTDIDWALRTMNIPKATNEMVQLLPKDSKAWLSAFVAGVNHYKAEINAGKIELPHEMRVLALENTPWTMQDSLALGRLGGVDVNWMSMIKLLEHYQSEHWLATFDTLKVESSSHQSSFGEQKLFKQLQPTQVKRQAHSEQLDILINMLNAFARSGSNSIAVDTSKTGKAPIIANDPHLGFLLPNVWMIAGLKSPSYHIVGMLPIGVPTFAFGRTPHIAWGGTNMRQEATDFVDVTALEHEFVTRTHTIDNRFWFSSKRISREHPMYGPILSDIDIINFPEGKHIALRWTGHQVSDELTAMLHLSKATHWQEMLESVDSFSVPGQNFIFATKTGLNQSGGDIGHILATHIPKRPIIQPNDLFVQPQQSDAYWQEILSATSLPYSINPSSGVIASANNKPYAITSDSKARIHWLFPADDRIERIYEVLTVNDKVTMADMMNLQRDITSPQHARLSKVLVEILLRTPLIEHSGEIVQVLTNWDGVFAAHSKEALIYHAFITHLSETLYTTHPELGSLDVYRSNGILAKVLGTHLESLAQKDQQIVLSSAVSKTLEYLDNTDAQVWGDIHRLEVQHLLGNVPILGSKYRWGNYPIGGYDTTIFKTAGDLELDEHTTDYGSQSRHVSDMADIDANYFVLYGGQDGYISSDNAYDQVPLWQTGKYIQLPLDLHKVRQGAQFISTYK